ncbi:MAG: YbgC/FadM family acyl-CoA thioesterase [Aestuariivita sp.]|nr:YbgC/FadM family acyl-CoA thioesterase [Aestuariivita sp.]
MANYHHFQLTVYYEDTDMAGIVYYANYLRFIERARFEIASELGLDQNKMYAQGLIFVVRHMEADFLGPAKLGDQLTVQSSHKKLSPVRWFFEQQIFRDDHIIFKALVTVVSTNLNGHPVALPTGINDIN